MCHTFQHGRRASVPTCQKRANFSFLRANVPINVPKVCRFFNLACQRRKACQFFKLACQHGKDVPFFSTSPAKRCANFSTIFFKIIIFFIYKIYLYLICFIYFVYFKYTLSIYFYMNIIFT